MRRSRSGVATRGVSFAGRANVTLIPERVGRAAPGFPILFGDCQPSGHARGRSAGVSAA
jgi:hypothetical protein